MQKITPFLWFDKNAEDAINFYTSVFPNSKTVSIKRYPEGPLGDPWKGLEGKILTAVFELMGQRFMALDGGPYFTFNPAVSLTLTCATPEEAKSFYDKLSPGGGVLMEFQEYPWSKAYGWFTDKFGLSWQINTQADGGKIIPSLMFVGDKFGKVEEAIGFYTSVFKNSSVALISTYKEGEGDVPGKVNHALFFLEGEPFTAMESSLEHKFAPNGAVSFLIECKDQAEIDYYWEKLTEGGDPKAQQCGWLQDKYGFSWQVTPDMDAWLNGPDKAGADRAMQAMLQMKKIDIAKLEEAYNHA